jgi:hypothetical protein
MNAVEASATTDLAWYVYGVVDATAPPPAGSGLEGEVAAVPEGPVAALVSRVPLSEYGEEPVRARLEDPAWLEEKARAHEAVLEGALRAGPVVPFRFLTLYRDEDELREFLTRRGVDLGGVLERVRGKVELGVKAFVDRARLAPALARENEAVRKLDAAIEAAASGKAYLLRRQRDQVVDEQCTRLLLDCAQASHARLSAAAEAAVSNPPQPRELSGRSEEMVLNGAYLVPVDDARLSAAVAELEAEYGSFGITFELTGPWPPYNFVPRDLAADDA